MNWRCDYVFLASFSTPQGAPLGEAPLAVDWVPAVRFAQFEALRACGAFDGGARPALVLPEWHREDGAPFIDGIRVERDRGEPARLALDYFSPAVIAASAGLVASGSLAPGQTFGYRIYALADQRPPQREAPAIEIEAQAEAPAIGAADIAALMRGAEPGGGRAGGASTAAQARPDSALRVFVPRALLDEATRLGRAAGEFETGGILLGRLLRDRGGEVCVRLSAQIPAAHTEATRESLRFTPATWASVDAALRLRASDEMALGWWHTHPFFCARCPPERRALCPLASPLFSEADRALHREVFQMPWNVALLLSFLGGDNPSYDLFSWQRGAIAASRFHVLPDYQPATETAHE